MIDDRYTELVKAAYEAQQAREGDEYKSLTTELATIDVELEALAAKRERTVTALETMDNAIVSAQKALEAHFRDQQQGGPNGTYGLDEDELLEAVKGHQSFEFGKGRPYSTVVDPLFDKHRATVAKEFGSVYGEAQMIQVSDDQFSSSRATGAHSED